jgi:two-component system, NtrC family, sensor histidine kinase PilS
MTDTPPARAPDEPTATPAAGGRPGSSLGLPDRRTLLGWLFIFRITLAMLLLVRAALVWEQSPDLAFYSAVGVIFVFALTAYGAYLALVRRIEPGLVFLALQAAVDLGLVTALVRVGGDAATALAALYVVVIAVYALLLPVAGGVAVALGASAAYLVSEAMTSPVGEVAPGLWGQIVVFAFVFILVAVLGHRLQHAWAQRSHLETELRRVQFEASEILRSIKTGVVTVDGEGRLAFANPAAERLLGFEASIDTGQPVLERLLALSPELHDAIVAGIRDRRRVPRGEGTVHRPDGTTFPIGLSTTTFDEYGAGRSAVTALFTDLSELKQLQELHLRAERLKAVAALSASLAHEIRNPLASIRSSVEQLALMAGADEDERTLCRLIVRESDRLSRLLGEFLDFSRVRAMDFARADLFAIAEETVRLVREHPDCGPTMVLELRGEPTPLDADADLLHRIVSNLLLNSVQACGGTGRVTVTVGPAGAASAPAGALDDAVRLEVEDDGPGIDPDVRARLFEPFVSRRPGGSGLGLAIVQRAVEAHRGLVLVDSAPGQGARFTVYLPRRPYREDAA